MNTDELLELERLATHATPGPWALWTGCSWRRFGSEHTGQTICEPTNHHIDGHPDLSFHNDADARYIAAAHPSAVLALIERIRHLEHTLEAEREVLASVSRDLNPHDALALGQRLEAIHMQNR